MKDWVVPFVIEPSAGVDRAVLAIINEAYKEEKLEDSSRIVLSLKPHLSPIKAAVIPFKKNNNHIVELAKELVDVYFKSSKQSFLSIGYCFYVFIFRALQKLIANTSFPLYRYWYRTASKEVLENYDEWMKEYKDWDGTSINDKVEGKKNHKMKVIQYINMRRDNKNV